MSVTIPQQNSQHRDTLIVAAFDAGKSGPEVALEFGMGRGQAYKIYKRVTGRSPGNPGLSALGMPVGMPVGMPETVPAELSVMEELAGCIEPTACKLRAGLPFERWSQIVKDLLVMVDGSPWWLGDALNYGEMCYGERYAQIADATGKAVQTLQNSAWVARQIGTSRRREGVSWSHHAEVAAMEPMVADGWLDLAEQECLTRNQLRARISEAKRIEAPEHPAGYVPSVPSTAPAQSVPSAQIARQNEQDEQTDAAGLTEFFSGLDTEHPTPGTQYPTPIQPDRCYESNLSQVPNAQTAGEWLPPSALDCAKSLASAVRDLSADFSNDSAQRTVIAALRRFEAATG